MARIRTVKPEFFQDADLIECETRSKCPYVMLVYEGLWCHADRRGVFVWEPRVLELNVLPFRPKGAFENALRALAKDGFVVKFKSGSHEYGWIPTLGKHQMFSVKERANPNLPDPPRADTYPAPAQHGANPVSDQLGSGSGSGRGRGLEGKGKGREREGCGEGGAPAESGAIGAPSPGAGSGAAKKPDPLLEERKAWLAKHPGATTDDFVRSLRSGS